MQCAVPICTCAEIPAGRVLLRVITEIICTYSVYNRYYGICEQHIISGFPKRITLLLRITSRLDRRASYYHYYHHHPYYYIVHRFIIGRIWTEFAVHFYKRVALALSGIINCYHMDYTWFVRGSIIRKIQVNRR